MAAYLPLLSMLKNEWTFVARNISNDVDVAVLVRRPHFVCLQTIRALASID